ncbi:hypothetical protein SDC9_187928 [bioreactor metagenome]|uniref:Uncharacterized protein n=1 Tax=bioreactor metagenome TaxID=1076179 RepID=A0A645HMV7_9ZZZZ
MRTEKLSDELLASPIAVYISGIEKRDAFFCCCSKDSHGGFFVNRPPGASDLPGSQSNFRDESSVRSKWSCIHSLCSLSCRIIHKPIRKELRMQIHWTDIGLPGSGNLPVGNHCRIMFLTIIAVCKSGTTKRVV